MRLFSPKGPAEFRPISLFLTPLFICLSSPGQPSPLMVTAVNDSQNLSAPLVTTTHGLLQGKTVEFDWGQADAFYGIPYARPPIGEFRFEKPQPLVPWEGVRDASQVSPIAIPWVRPINWEQTEVRAKYSEDCLHLNIFRPHQQASFQTQLLPVLAIIHGGGFQRGSARRYGNLDELGRKYLRRGILIAVLQFRIGVLGFASNGQPNFAGNFAYWDQAAALRWLHDNLAAFGGDRQRITLFGYSSGSSSVGTHSVATYTRDLFAQSVQMSGSVMMVRAASEQVVEETHKMAEAAGCPKGQDVKAFLKALSIDQLFDAVDKIGSTRVGLNYVKFGPRIDGDFVPDDFAELIAAASPKPTIIGLNEMESLENVLFGLNDSLHWDAVPKEQFSTFSRADFEEYLRRVAIRSEDYGNEAAESLLREVVAFYLEANGTTNGTSMGPDFYLEKLVEVMSDLQFRVPFAWEVRNRVAAGNRHLYSYTNKYVNARYFPAHVRLHRSFHDNDHSYLFRNPARKADFEFDANDEKVEQQWNEFLANFVMTGNPSKSTINWPAAHPEKPFANQMIVDLSNTELEEFNERRIEFWDRMVAKYPQYNIVLGRKQRLNEEHKWTNGAERNLLSISKFWILLLAKIILYAFFPY